MEITDSMRRNFRNIVQIVQRNFVNIKFKRFALLLEVLIHFEYVNCYQVLHNVTYVATHLSLMNLYRI